MPSQANTNIIVVIIDFHLPTHSLPFVKWQHLKDEARTALTRNHHQPGSTDLHVQCGDGRSVGYVICQVFEDAGLIYDYLKRKFAMAYGARVHSFDTSRSTHLVQCNCVGGHIGSHDSAYIRNARYVAAHDPARHAAVQSPVLYTQPAGQSPTSSSTDSMYGLANGMSGLAVSPVGYPQSLPYPSYVTTTYDQGYTGGPTYAVQGLNAPAPYAQYDQYAPTYAVHAQAYPQQMHANSQYVQYPQYPVGYVDPMQGYAGHSTATATHGQASASASYGVNASGQLVNTTQGCVQTELNRLVFRNLDPKTNEKDLRKEIEKAKVIPEHVKVNKYDNIKKKNISAIATFRNYHDANKVKEHFEIAPRHIKNRPVGVAWGKESAPPPPPMVLSSTNPN